MTTTSDIMDTLVSGSTALISTPETIEKMKAEGVKFDTKSETSEQYVARLYSEKSKHALDALGKTPRKPDIAIPTILSLYDEITECIIFGVYGAAITLSAILVEYSLKYAINQKQNGNTYVQADWDKLESMELGPTIVKARSLGLIEEGVKLLLDDFRVKMRNPYLHYNIKKITNNVVARKVKKFDLVSKKVSEVDLSADKNPATWSLAKKFVDREQVFHAFLFADQLVRDLLVR